MGFPLPTSVQFCLKRVATPPPQQTHTHNDVTVSPRWGREGGERRDWVYALCSTPPPRVHPGRGCAASLSDIPQVHLPHPTPSKPLVIFFFFFRSFVRSFFFYLFIFFLKLSAGWANLFSEHIWRTETPRKCKPLPRCGFFYYYPLFAIFLFHVCLLALPCARSSLSLPTLHVFP